MAGKATQRNFGQWLKEKFLGQQTSSKELYHLAMGPSSTVLMYEGYDINVYTFYMRKQDAKSANQNSGVQIEAYYGFIEEIWELDYGLEEMKVPLFRCKWVRVPKGVMTDKYGMRTIDFKHLAYLDEPFIFAKDVVQVFYGKT